MATFVKWPALSWAVLAANSVVLGQIQLPEALVRSGGVTAITADVTVTVSSNTPSGRFTQTQAGKYYRSSSGKTRQDSSFGAVITDPVARTITSIDHKSRRATIVRLPAVPKPPSGTSPGSPAITLPAGNTRNLGESVIDGRPVSGKRVESSGSATTGQAGSSVTEVWTSDELRLPIWTRQTSPGGETSQKYENIKVGEPDSSLFLVPTGYTVTEKIAAAPGQPGSR